MENKKPPTAVKITGDEIRHPLCLYIIPQNTIKINTDLFSFRITLELHIIQGFICPTFMLH